MSDDSPPVDDRDSGPDDRPGPTDGTGPNDEPNRDGTDPNDEPNRDGAGPNGGDRTVLGVAVTERRVAAAGAAVAVLLLFYSVLIAGELLLWVVAVAPFLFLYLFWRLVRAHERLAAAQERRARE